MLTRTGFVMAFFALLIHFVAIMSNFLSITSGGSEAMKDLFVLAVIHFSLLAMMHNVNRRSTAKPLIATILPFYIALMVGNLILGLIIGGLVTVAFMWYFRPASSILGRALVFFYGFSLFIAPKEYGALFGDILTFEFVTSAIQRYGFVFLFLAFLLHIFRDGFKHVRRFGHVPSEKEVVVDKKKTFSLKRKVISSNATHNETQALEEERVASDEVVVVPRTEKNKTIAKDGVFNRFNRGIFEKLDRYSRH